MVPNPANPSIGASPIPASPGGNDFTQNPRGASSPGTMPSAGSSPPHDFTLDHRSQPTPKLDCNPSTVPAGGNLPYSGPPAPQRVPFKLNNG